MACQVLSDILISYVGFQL